MRVIQIDPAEVIQISKRLEHGALFEQWAHIVQALFAAKADGERVIVIGVYGRDGFSAACKVFGCFTVEPFGKIKINGVCRVGTSCWLSGCWLVWVEPLISALLLML